MAAGLVSESSITERRANPGGVKISFDHRDWVKHVPDGGNLAAKTYMGELRAI
jgi:hypothetical protein